MSSSSGFLLALLQQLPAQITIAVCAILALSRWKKSPKAARLAFISLLLLFLHAPISLAFVSWIPTLFHGDSLEMSKVYFVTGFISYTAMAIAFAPLVLAVFIERRQHANPAQ